VKPSSKQRFIAAVNHCATQRQSFSANCETLIKTKVYRSRKPLRHPKTEFFSKL
jgi:hypothetical protein